MKRSERWVFLSFKTEDRDHAFRLRTALVNAGFDVWWQEQIQCGREWHGEVDLAVAGAGCIVVVWSHRSIQSPWVRHEASQAIARGVYAPARIEPMDIESPYDRIQATDLINWSGDPNHPGLLNLLQRVTELMPPPVPPVRRFGRFLYRNKGALVASTVALLAFALLLRLSATLDAQVNRQAQLAADISRTLQPIRDLSVMAFVDVDHGTQGLDDYLKSLENVLLVPGQRVLHPQLPRGVYVSRSGPSGPEEVSIGEESGLWPPKSDSRSLYHVVRFVELSLEFRLATSNAEPASGADLVIRVGSYDPDGSGRGEGDQSRIGWEFQNNAANLGVDFTHAPLPKWWESNGKIASVPDLENSEMTVSFESTMFPSLDDPSGQEALTRSRQGLRLNTLFLNYSGRKLMIKASEMRESTGPKGLRRYTVRLTPELVNRLSK